MDAWWRWYERLRGLLMKGRVEREIEEEMRIHIDMETEALIAAGHPPEEARRLARVRFGGVEAQRTRAREQRFGRSVDVLVQDVRYALRLLVKHPGATAAALATLALGIGGSAAVLGMVKGILLAPLPYESADRAVWIQTSWKGSPDARISPAEYLDYEAGLDAVFSHVGVYSTGSLTLAGDGEPQSVASGGLSWQTFGALGVRPILGRTFTAEEDRDRVPVALIGEGLWQRELGGSPDVIGQTLVVNQRQVEIIGVLPAAFRLPERLLAGDREQIFLPQGIDAADVDNRGSHYLSGVARLRDGVSLAEANAALATLIAAFRERYPDDYPAHERFAAVAEPLARTMRGPVSLPILVLAAAVGLVLLITCANIAGLLLARVDRRQREFALRAALGAPGRRIGAQVAVESLLLALLGGLLGLGLGQAILASLTAGLPSGLDWLAAARIDGSVVVGAILLSAITGLVFGWTPARRARHLGGIAAHGSRSTTDRHHRRARQALSVAQIALALVLLVCAGLLTRSFGALARVDPGFRAHGSVTARLALPFAAYPENGDLVTFFRSLEASLAAIPGVDAAGMVTNLPLATSLGDMDFEIEGRPLAAGASEPVADWQVATPGYFRAMGLRVNRGRPIRPSDRADTTGVVVVNESFAGTYFPEDDPLGKRFRLLGDGTGPALAEIVGVVADVKHHTLAESGRPQMYFAQSQFRFWGSRRAVSRMTLVLASSRPPESLRPDIIAALRTLDPTLPLSRFRTIEDVRSASVALPRLLTQAIACFALVALALAAIGIYGVMAQWVGQRIPEIGIRSALGARRAVLAWSVVGEGLKLTLVGIGCGALVAFALARVIEGLLFAVSPLDGATFALVSVVLTLAALGACYLPVRRALAVDPARLLRSL